jgi:TolB-like protein/DNA-binding winged helix-turn-helix (wHTH) protein
MERPTTSTLRIGDWSISPLSGQISRDGEAVRVEVRTMRLLLCLAEHPGEVVSIETLLDQVWPDVTVTPDSVYQAVTSLRRLLGDDTKNPTYIATVPRLGYRMVAPVSPQPANSQIANSATQPVSDHSIAPEPPPNHGQLTSAVVAPETMTAVPPVAIGPTHTPRTRASLLLLAGAVIALALVAALAFRGKLARESNAPNPPAEAAAASQPEKSVGVIPFLDLTEGMTNGEFADGMTEELIDKLSKVPGLRVPSPTSSFYYRDKTVTVAEIARALRVAYVLDGSVRKSGDRVRVATRLVRADNGYVVWSETYDRPFGDIIMVQDNIANAVTKALKTSIDAKPQL